MGFNRKAYDCYMAAADTERFGQCATLLDGE